mmetsp:Transcript_5074/g.7371  ORF Transcript_5074/g.7371 Transcript_5074/m.7371 type:complete len:314 (-) Transcript_5074:89-1030(-)
MNSIAIENTDPAVVEPSAHEIRAYVPKSDRRLVLAAIDNQLTVAKSAWKEKHADQNNTDPAKEEFFMKCLEQTAASLKQQLEAITVPADEEEEDVEELLDSFQMRLLSTRPDDEEDDDCDGESISSDEEDENEISFDDDDIVDEEVLERVKKCRNDVREVAARVISAREVVCKKALNVGERDIAHVMELHGLNSSSGDEDEEGVNEQIGDGNERDVLNPMHVALQTLTSSLQDVDSGLAEKVNDLKNTIGVVDSYIEKNERLSQGDENVLSKTEKALLASEQVKKTVESTVDEDDDAQMNPDKKLARLLAGVL